MKKIEKEILPLMKQIYKICKENKINYLSACIFTEDGYLTFDGDKRIYFNTYSMNEEINNLRK